MRKTQNHSQFWTLFRQLPGVDLNDVNTCKDDYVWQASNMLTTSLNDFLERNPSGYKQMIAKLQNAVTTAKNTNGDIKIYRSGVLTRLQKYGVDTTNWTKVNAFLKQPQVAGKVMYELSVPELRNLITKLESMIAKKKAKDNETKRQMQMN